MKGENPYDNSTKIYGCLSGSDDGNWFSVYVYRQEAGKRTQVENT